MKWPWLWLSGVALFAIAAILLNGIQSGFWYLVFGGFPPPLMWLVALVYVSVTRPLWEATVLTYVLTLVNAAYTIVPFEALLVFSVALMFALMLIRERVYWGGSAYFMLMVGVASLMAPVFFWLTSRWFDKNPIFIPEIFDWLISGLLTMLVSLPLYYVFQLIDAISNHDAVSEGTLGPR